jgi:hypothetical protein
MEASLKCRSLKRRSVKCRSLECRQTISGFHDDLLDHPATEVFESINKGARQIKSRNLLESGKISKAVAPVGKYVFCRFFFNARQYFRRVPGCHTTASNIRNGTFSCCMFPTVQSMFVDQLTGRTGTTVWSS